jgi:hypothetical protein
VTAELAQRAAALAAIALVLGVGALALVHEEPAADPRPAPANDGGGWYQAVAGVRGEPEDAERTTCGEILTARALGVAHPVLPCRAKLYLEVDGDTVLTEVIDNRMQVRGRQFELTPALARRLGVEGTQAVKWRFAVRDAS